jgi:hypothetical protein
MINFWNKIADFILLILFLILWVLGVMILMIGLILYHIVFYFVDLVEQSRKLWTLKYRRDKYGS